VSQRDEAITQREGETGSGAIGEAPGVRPAAATGSAGRGAQLP
jgi:hypothetical protein